MISACFKEKILQNLSLNIIIYNSDRLFFKHIILFL